MPKNILLKYLKYYFKGKVIEYPSMAKSVTWQIFSYVDKTKGRKTQKQAATKDGCSEGPAKHLQVGNSEFGGVHGLKTFPSKC